MRIPNTRISGIERPPIGPWCHTPPGLPGRAAPIPGALRECPPQFRSGRERTPVAHTVTFIRGDGTGPEISEATARVLEGTGVEFEWDWQDAGADVYEEEGTPLPDRVLDSIKENKIAIKGPITTPVGSGFRSINVALRKELDLYACLRPCKKYEGVRTIFKDEDVDIVIVRENHEDLYAGVEYEKGEENTEKLREFIKDTEGTELREDIGVTSTATRASSSRSGSSTTSAISWCRGPLSTTCWCCPICTATSSPTSPPA